MLPNVISNAPKKQRKRYSGKKKRHTLKGQLLVDGFNREVLSTFFGDGSVHDLTLFCQSRTLVCAFTVLIGDLGYVGIDKYHSNSRTPHRKNCGRGLTKSERALTSDQKCENRVLSRERIVVEHVNRRLKVFRILSERYRNRCRCFCLRFNLICAIYNYEYVHHPRADCSSCSTKNSSKRRKKTPP
jgi:hypothetical protein